MTKQEVAAREKANLKEASTYTALDTTFARRTPILRFGLRPLSSFQVSITVTLALTKSVNDPRTPSPSTVPNQSQSHGR
jgi:hypothetical protein